MVTGQVRRLNAKQCCGWYCGFDGGPSLILGLKDGCSYLTSRPALFAMDLAQHRTSPSVSWLPIRCYHDWTIVRFRPCGLCMGTAVACLGTGGSDHHCSAFAAATEQRSIHRMGGDKWNLYVSLGRPRDLANCNKGTRNNVTPASLGTRKGSTHSAVRPHWHLAMPRRPV